jgi:hypothetical protein
VFSIGGWPRRLRLSSLSDPASADILLNSFLAVRDNYSCHIAHFLRFLKSNHLALDLSSVRAYFVHLNASPLAVGTNHARAVRPSGFRHLKANLAIPVVSVQHGLPRGGNVRRSAGQV